jgi:glyoxylase-like metal-dependent hydrolase (beta-lactamase superfamily II)
VTLRQVAEGVLVHESACIQTNAVVVRGDTGVLLVDPGLTNEELLCLAGDLRELGQRVVAGFSTHADWDHVLWHPSLGDAPRYGTERCAASIREVLSRADWEADVIEGLPPEIADDTPLELFGLVAGLPANTDRIPWDGPTIRILEHSGHAPGHAALLVEERGVLIAGDMLSDVLVPMPDLYGGGPGDSLEDYLTGLRLLERVAEDVRAVVPGHGSVGDAAELRARIERDRAYVHALRDGRDSDDPRIGPDAKPGWEWVAQIHEGHLERLSGEAPTE